MWLERWVEDGVDTLCIFSTLCLMAGFRENVPLALNLAASGYENKTPGGPSDGFTEVCKHNAWSFVYFSKRDFLSVSYVLNSFHARTLSSVCTIQNAELDGHQHQAHFANQLLLPSSTSINHHTSHPFLPNSYTTANNYMQTLSDICKHF